jgi:hypothetical protein
MLYVLLNVEIKIKWLSLINNHFYYLINTIRVCIYYLVIYFVCAQIMLYLVTILCNNNNSCWI